jgi:predicted nuclease with TOPRIM domain
MSKDQKVFSEQGSEKTGISEKKNDPYQSIRILPTTHNKAIKISKARGLKLVEVYDQAINRYIPYEDLEAKYQNAVKDLEEMKEKYQKLSMEFKEKVAKYDQYAQELEELRPLKEFSFMLDLFKREPLDDIEIRKMKESGERYALAVELFKSGQKFDTVKMTAELPDAVAYIAYLEAIDDGLRRLIYQKKREVGMVKPPQMVAVPTRVDIKEVDYHRVITSPIISLYYALSVKLIDYKKSFPEFIEECVIDAMTSRGVYLTALVPRMT